MFWKKYKDTNIPEGSFRGVLKYAWLPTKVYNGDIKLEIGERYDKQLGYIWLDYYVEYQDFDIETYSWKKRKNLKGWDYNCDLESIESFKNNKYTDNVVWLYWEIKNREKLEKELIKELNKKLDEDIKMAEEASYKLEPVNVKTIPDIPDINSAVLVLEPNDTAIYNCMTRPPFNGE